MNRHERAATVRALESSALTWLNSADDAEASGDTDTAQMYRAWAAQEARQAAEIVRRNL